MSQGSARCSYRVLLGVIVALTCWAGGARAVEDGGDALEKGEVGEDERLELFEASRDVLLAPRPFHGRDLGAVALTTPDGRGPRTLRAKLDLSPAVQEILGFLRRHGLPLQQQLDKKGRGPVGVYADFNIGQDLPALSFHLGDRPLEPLGAFYSNKRGFRCALSWPVGHFTLRLEAGEHSEFGYYGIAGIQWLHPSRPLAIGIGLPMNLKDADGDVGFVMQLRMKLN